MSHRVSFVMISVLLALTRTSASAEPGEQAMAVPPPDPTGFALTYDVYFGDFC